MTITLDVSVLFSEQARPLSGGFMPDLPLIRRGLGAFCSENRTLVTSPSSVDVGLSMAEEDVATKIAI